MMKVGHTEKDKQARAKAAEKALRNVFDLLYRGKGDELVDKLMKKYGSAGAVVEAGKDRLIKNGVSSSNALLLSLLPDLVRHTESIRMGKHPPLRTLLATEEFLRYRYKGVNIEKFYMLALDVNGRLIKCVHLQDGTEDSAPFYMKHILSETMRTGAKSIVIVHNHPNSTPNPSDADIQCTRDLMGSLQILGIPLLDHIVMLDKYALSMRGFGYILEGEWRMQNRNHKILQNWLKDWDIETAFDKIKHLPRSQKSYGSK